MQEDEQQRILRAILLQRESFTSKEISLRVGVSEDILQVFFQTLEPYLELQNDRNPPAYRIKPESREVLRDLAHYPPRSTCEGGWGISK